MLALRHARVPTIAVSRGVAVSGGCEVLMHCTRVVAAPKSPIGLAEASIGVMPAGGGVKEMACRAALRGTDDFMPNLERAFAVLSGARIAYARDAKQFDLLTEHDVVSDSEDLLSVATQLGHSLSKSGYSPPPRNPLIRVAGSEGCERLIARKPTRGRHAAPASRQCRDRPRVVRRRRRRAERSGTDICSISSAATSSNWCKRR